MVTHIIKLTFACLLLGWSFQSNGQSSKVLANEQSRFSAMVAGDTLQLRQWLSDDLVYIHSNSIQESKNAHLSNIASRKIVYEQMRRESPAVRIKGRLAIVNGSIRVKGLLNQNPFELQMLYTAVYEKKKGKWLLTNWQTTKIPPPNG
jgi:hypothetical protein